MPVFLPGKVHGQRGLWGTVHGVTKESDTTEQLNSNHLIYSKGREENLSIVFHIRDRIYSVLLQMPRQYLEVTEGNAAQYKELQSLIFFFILPHHIVGGISAP